MRVHALAQRLAQLLFRARRRVSITARALSACSLVPTAVRFFCCTINFSS
jgi:hypothetical protein